MSAIFDQYGNFIFSTQTTRTKIRWLRHEYSAFNTLHPPMPISGSNHYMATLRVEPGVGLQLLPEDESQRLASCPIYDDDNSAFQYRHGFYRDCQRGLGPEGILADHHADVRNDLGGCPRRNGRRASVPSSNQGSDCSPGDGMLALPFKMVLTKKEVQLRRRRSVRVRLSVTLRLADQFSTTVNGTDALGPAGVTSRNRLP